MQTVPEFLTALLPVLGVILGAGLQHLFSKSGERRKQLETLRSQAYVDYLRAVAEIAQLRKTDPKKRSEWLAAAADAKTRICVYGASSVITALAAFENSNPVLDSSASRTQFLDLCTKTRRQNLGRAGTVALDDLSLVLFGRRARNETKRDEKVVEFTDAV